MAERAGAKYLDRELLGVMTVILVAGGLVTGFVLRAYFSTFPYLSDTHERWGQFGDYFGGILNPAIAGLALMTLLITLDIQRREWRDAKTAIARQSFERTFFEMVGLHNDITTGVVTPKDWIQYEMSLPTSEIGELSGRVCFGYFRGGLWKEYKKTRAAASELRRVKLAYKKIYDKHEEILGHYYRNFYRILKYVEASRDISDKKKKDYTGILRAQLSSDELFVMYYSSLSIEGEKLRPLLEEYSMFDNLRPGKLIKIRHADVDFYKREAWGCRAVEVQRRLDKLYAVTSEERPQPEK